MFRLSHNYRYLNNSKNLGIFYASIQCRKRHKSSLDPGNVEFLVNLLGIDDSSAKRLVVKYCYKKRFSRNELIRTHAICVRFGIINDVLAEAPNILFLSSFLLEHRLNLFKDMGCENMKSVVRIGSHYLIGLNVAELKELQVLPADADVTKNLANCLHKPPPDVPPIESYPDDYTFLNIQANVLRHYLKWKFGYTDEEVEQFFTPRMRLQLGSFSLLKQMVDLLDIEFGFQAEKIKRNKFMLNKSPHNTREILDKIKYVGNTEIRALIIKYPRVLNVMVDALQEKIEVLKEFNLRDETLCTFPDIYTLSSATIRRRLIEFQSIPEIRGHWNTPRFLMLIFYINTVKKRLEILRQLNVKCVSRFVLCTSEAYFRRYITIGSDKTRGRDITRFLSYEFNLDVSDPRIAAIKRHPSWCYVALLYLHESYEFLSEQFSHDDILPNIQLLLYKRERIAGGLEKVDSMKLDPSWKLTPARKLALCLYNIEKENHFDSSGIWSCNENVSTGISSSALEDPTDKRAWQILRYTSKS